MAACLFLRIIISNHFATNITAEITANITTNSEFLKCANELRTEYVKYVSSTKKLATLTVKSGL